MSYLWRPTESNILIRYDVSGKMNRVWEDVGSIHGTILGEHRKKLLDWLSPIDYAKLQGDTLRKRRGTGKWFLKAAAFTKMGGKQAEYFILLWGA